MTATGRSRTTTKTPKLTAPFPYFGGKRQVASIVWERLGNPSHYLEPFAGSLAVLLARPGEGLVEIVGDADGFIANFWRALQAEPEKVWDKTYYPCIEVDLHARAKWLREREPELVEKLRADIEFYDVQVAGWWLWGIALAMGGVYPTTKKSIPAIDNNQGITGRTLADLQALSARLRKTRIICGDWTRTLGFIERNHHTNSAIFLDPPYTHQCRDTNVYHHDTSTLAAEVAAWAIEHPDMRIAYCGYECDEYTFPSDWECVPWKTGGGMANIGNGQGKANSHRERIWFSPACDRPAATTDLYNDGGDE